MKAKLRLFYSVTDQQYFVYYFKDYSFILYKVENINPLNLYPLENFGIQHPSEKKLIDEVEDFAKKEFKKINNDF